MSAPSRTLGEPAYHHTQRAPLGWILCGWALACFAIAAFSGDPPGVAILVVIGTVFVILGAAFQHLTVEDQGNRLAIRFGPLPLFWRTVRYADIKHAQVGRTQLLDGWGIHMSLRGGWVWNIWGRDCVVVSFDNQVLRIGTDDGENLARFLQSKVPSSIKSSA